MRTWGWGVVPRGNTLERLDPPGIYHPHTIQAEPPAIHQNYYVFLLVMALVASAADKQILVSTLYSSFSPDFRVVACLVTLVL